MKRGKLSFVSDYMEGAHPAVLDRLISTNREKSAGYGKDTYSEEARDKIRRACACPGAEIHFLVGGTQTNATMIHALLRSYEGVLAAETGHISVHEAGAIELGGHKVMTLPQRLGKLRAEEVRAALESYERDESREHTVRPGMVYLSQPTEYGTLYSLRELEELSDICRKKEIFLYVDGARLAYGLACPENDVGLRDLARLCDVFYIGGTKCGALFGEAVVIPEAGRIPHLFTVIKQHGALLAKGRVLGIQFDGLFSEGLYERIGAEAVKAARRVQEALKELGYQLYFEAPANQIFCVLENERLKRLGERVELGIWENYDKDHTVVRLAFGWATEEQEVEELIGILKEHSPRRHIPDREDFVANS